MKQLFLAFVFIFIFSCTGKQESRVNQTKIKEDLNEILSDLSQNYVYLQEKNVDLNCIREYYEKQIQEVKSKEEVILFFEYLLNEFYDSHLHLNTNINSSFRLYSPIYATIKHEKPIISNVWQTQIKDSIQNIIGAEILKINEIDFEDAIKEFPTHCNDKNSLKVKEWIINKILAGRYNKPRILTLKLKSNKTIEFDLDKVELKEEKELIVVNKINEIGIIRINNSLGQDEIVNEFDKALDSLLNTKGLIIDLRNTVNGGDSYEARGIMGRFISEPKPYQMHQYFEESYNNPEHNPKIERRWVEYVVPRANQYQKPVVILVGRWTGSMGEGMAIGFEGMKRAKIIGTEMERLAGEMSGFSFKNQDFGYRLSTAKLFHINGIPREKYIPTFYVNQTTTEKDETLKKGIELINKMTE